MLFDKIIDYQDEAAEIYALEDGKEDLLDLSKWTVQQLILIGLIEPAYTELEKDTETRKQLRNIVVKHHKSVRNFLDSCFQRLETIMNTIEDVEDFGIAETQVICSIFHLIQCLTKHDEFIKLLELDRYYSKIEKFLSFWLAINPEADSLDEFEYNEFFTNAPFAVFKKDEYSLVFHYFYWAGFAMKLIFLRLDRYYRPDKKMSRDTALEIFNITIQLTGRISPFYMDCLPMLSYLYPLLDTYEAFLKECELIDFESFGFDLEAFPNHVHKSLTAFICAKIMSMEENADVTEKHKNALVLKYLDKAEEFLDGDTNSPAFEEIQLLRKEINTPKHSCKVCSKSESSSKSLLRCSRCRKVRYCGKECQKKDWPEHKKICSPPKK